MEITHSGASIPEGTESFQVNLLKNQETMSDQFEPGLIETTIALQNILENQTNLKCYKVTEI